MEKEPKELFECLSKPAHMVSREEVSNFRERRLTLKEKEEALGVAKQVVSEGNKLLRDRDRVELRDTKDRLLRITGKEHIETVVTGFRGAELLVDTIEDAKKIGNNVYDKQDLYVFYPDSVVNDVRYRPLDSWTSYDIERVANAQDITGLLENIRNSRSLE